jgi:hypothetical protein
MRLGEPGTGAAPQPGTAGGAQPGWAADPQPMGGPGGAQPGWAADPRPMRGSGGWSRSSDGPGPPSDALESIGEDLAGAAMGAAARFIGRKIARRMQDRLDQAMTAVTAKQQDVLQAQIAIAERHPGLRACLDDQVVFLAGGSHALPMPNLSTITVEQADALVAQLQ